MLESNIERLRPWKPDLVMISTAVGAPMDLPENPVFRTTIRMVKARNISRSVLQKICDPHYLDNALKGGS